MLLPLAIWSRNEIRISDWNEEASWTTSGGQPEMQAVLVRDFELLMGLGDRHRQRLRTRSNTARVARALDKTGHAAAECRAGQGRGG